jgi:hypothetical protein
MKIPLARWAMWAPAHNAPHTWMRFAAPAYAIGIAFLIAVGRLATW